MGDDDQAFLGVPAGVEHGKPVLVLHLEAVDELVELDGNGHLDAGALEYLRQMALPEGKFTLDFVVMLVESSAGHDHTNGCALHGDQYGGKPGFC